MEPPEKSLPGLWRLHLICDGNCIDLHNVLTRGVISLAHLNHLIICVFSPLNLDDAEMERGR